MAHTTYPTLQFRTVNHSFDQSPPQPSTHVQASTDPQWNCAHRSIFPARLRYSPFPRPAAFETVITTHALATSEQPAYHDSTAYQPPESSKNRRECPAKRETSLSPISASDYGAMSQPNTVRSTRSQNRAVIKSLSSPSGSDADDEAISSSLQKRGNARGGSATMGSGSLRPQDPNNRFVICKYGERAGEPTCGAIIKVFHGRRSHLQNHLYNVHWKGDKTGTAECLWGHACSCDQPINKDGMARHILDTPHYFGDRAEPSTGEGTTFNQFFCPHCGKCFSRTDSRTRHINHRTCRWPK